MVNICATSVPAIRAIGQSRCASITRNGDSVRSRRPLIGLQRRAAAPNRGCRSGHRKHRPLLRLRHPSTRCARSGQALLPRWKARGRRALEGREARARDLPVFLRQCVAFLRPRVVFLRLCVAFLRPRVVFLRLCVVSLRPACRVPPPACRVPPPACRVPPPVCRVPPPGVSRSSARVSCSSACVSCPSARVSCSSARVSCSSARVSCSSTRVSRSSARVSCPSACVSCPSACVSCYAAGVRRTSSVCLLTSGKGSVPMPHWSLACG